MRRAMVFPLTLLVITLLLLPIAWFTVLTSDEFDEDLGGKQIDLFDAAIKAERAMTYIDLAMPYAYENALHTFANKGGYSDASPCGSYRGVAVWGENCYGDTSTFSDVVNQELNTYLVEYPDVIPTSNYNFVVSNELIGHAREDLSVLIGRYNGYYDLADHEAQTIIGDFAWPANSYVVTSCFGERQLVRNEPSRFHRGIDIRAQSPVPVFSIADGKVITVVTGPTTMNTIEVEHAQGIKSRYLHNSVVQKKVGDTVRRGEQIALSGSQGTRDPHIHFEVHKKKGGSYEAIDPLHPSKGIYDLKELQFKTGSICFQTQYASLIDPTQVVT